MPSSLRRKVDVFESHRDLQNPILSSSVLKTPGSEFHCRSRTHFEKFRQGSTGTGTRDHVKREYEGTGLGLSIVRELAVCLVATFHSAVSLGRVVSSAFAYPSSRGQKEDGNDREHPGNAAISHNAIDYNSRSDRSGR